VSEPLSPNTLFRVQHHAGPVLDIDPWLRWGLLLYPRLAEVAQEDAIGSVDLDLALFDDDARFGNRFVRLLEDVAISVAEQLESDGHEPTGLPGSSPPSAAQRVRRCLRRLGEYLLEHGDEIDMAPTRPRPAGLLWIDLSQDSRALVDPVTLETVDVDGRLIGFEISGVPGTPGATPAADAIGRLAAVDWALQDASDVGRSLLLQQRLRALRSAALDWAVTEDDRSYAAAIAEDAGRGLSPDGLLLLGLSLETCRETLQPLGTLRVGRCRALVEEVVEAAPLLIADALDAVAAANREVTALGPVYADAPVDLADRARLAALRAAVATRRGQPAAREWSIAARRWDAVSASNAAYCRALEAPGAEPGVVTFDAVTVLGGYVR
jgi:hypothetical protein